MSKGLLVITCPFCDGTFYVASNVYGVAHSSPPCETFLKLDPLAYLTESRQRLEQLIDEEAPIKPFERN